VIKFKPEKNSFLISNNSRKNESLEEVSYGYFFNTTGLHADEVAQKFNIGKELTILPFKGIYWQLDSKAPFNFKTNLYPVPDLEMPFLGVHVTPSPDGTISLGPTAIPALGRENYYNFDGIEPFKVLDFFGDIAYQLIKNSGGFRKYSYEQALHGIKPLFLRASKLLIPKLKNNHLIRSKKVGIRAQLYDKKTGTLIKDFRMDNGISSTHILNAISPAFTASFSLADLILKQSNL
jgi:L-2-hydroxyglutarate oxidase LhgO